MKIYRALLGMDPVTSALSAVVLENTLGVDVVWSRGAVGQYGAFVNNTLFSDKTFLRVTPCAVSDVDGEISIWIQPGTQDGFGLVTMANGQYTDQILQMGQLPVEILVYS